MLRRKGPSGFFVIGGKATRKKLNRFSPLGCADKMTEKMTCVDCDKVYLPNTLDPVYCCDGCGCYTCAECHSVDDEGKVYCACCVQEQEDEEDDEMTEKCKEMMEYIKKNPKMLNFVDVSEEERVELKNAFKDIGVKVD